MVGCEADHFLFFCHEQSANAEGVGFGKDAGEAGVFNCSHEDLGLGKLEYRSRKVPYGKVIFASWPLNLLVPLT